MSTIRVERRSRFTIVDNTAIEDERLSFKAVGLLTFLLSKPNGWTISYRQLSKVRTDGEHSVRAGLVELENAGYLSRRRRRLDDGSFGWESVIRESSASAQVAPCGGNPGTGNPGMGNRRRSKDCQSKDPYIPNFCSTCGGCPAESDCRIVGAHGEGTEDACPWLVRA